MSAMEKLYEFSEDNVNLSDEYAFLTRQEQVELFSMCANASQDIYDLVIKLNNEIYDYLNGKYQQSDEHDDSLNFKLMGDL